MVSALLACKNSWGGWIPPEVSGKVCLLGPLTLRKIQQQEIQTLSYSSCTHTVCTNAYHTPLKSLMHREMLQSHWFIGSAYTCGLTVLLTLLTAAEVKTGFKVPAKQDLAAHLRRVDWPELWNTVRAAYTPHTITHAPNDQCNWAESFYHRYSVLYSRSVMHHLACINISLPLFSSPKSAYVQGTRAQFLTAFMSSSRVHETLNGCN